MRIRFNSVGIGRKTISQRIAQVPLGERIQKRALKIIHPELLTYREALAVCNRPTLRKDDKSFAINFFYEVVSNPKRKLHKLLPSRNECQINLRAKRVFSVNFNTLRFRNTFINSSALQYKLILIFLLVVVLYKYFKRIIIIVNF